MHAVSLRFCSPPENNAQRPLQELDRFRYYAHAPGRSVTLRTILYF